jgi:hypothetical protein
MAQLGLAALMLANASQRGSRQRQGSVREAPATAQPGGLNGVKALA